MKSFTKFSKAFTIIELIVVITVIGILATIVTVSYSGSQKSANKSSFNATAQQVKLKLGDYYTDNNKFPSKKGSSTTDADSVMKYLNDVNSPTIMNAFNATYVNSTTPAFTYAACAQGTNPCTSSSTQCDNSSIICGVYSITVPVAAWNGNATDTPITVTGP